MVRPLRRYVMRRAVQKGFFEGSRFWTLLGTLGLAMKLLKKLARNEPELAYQVELKPGQTVVISHDRTVKAVKRRR